MRKNERDRFMVCVIPFCIPVPGCCYREDQPGNRQQCAGNSRLFDSEDVYAVFSLIRCEAMRFIGLMEHRHTDMVRRSAAGWE